MNIKHFLIAAALTVAVAAPAIAHAADAASTPSDKRLQTDTQRDVNQEKRIEQGEKSGALTDKEAANLQHKEAVNEKLQAKAAASGNGVSAKEQARIRHRENKTSKVIARKKHNAATTPAGNQ